MATLGSTSKPTTSQEAFGLNVKNQHAIQLTMPAGGPWLITHVAVWAGGLNSTTGFRTCVWSSGGTIRANSLLQNLTDWGALGLGDATLENHAMTTPYEAYGGQVVWIGYARSSSGASQHPLTGSGTHVDYDNSTIPGNISTGTTHPGTLGAYLTYVAANDPPTAPSLTNPANGARILSTDTVSFDFKLNDEEDNGDNTAVTNGLRYDLQVDNNSDYSSPVWNISGQSANWTNYATYWAVVGRAYGGSALTAGTTYYWRARTTDSDGDTGPWSSSRTFKINRLPVGTKSSPAASGIPLLHNIGSDTTTWTAAGSHAKPTMSWTYSDADSDAQASYRVKIYDASSGGSTVYDSGAVNSAATSHNVTTALVMGAAMTQQYWWTLQVKDAYEWSAESSRTAFKVRWGQAIYEYAVPGGTTSTTWAWANAPVPVGTSGFLFRTATGAAGSGASSWKTSISQVTPNAYLNVMVRLAPAGVGLNTALPNMTFSYLADSLVPEKWTFSPTSDFALDAEVRRYGSQSLSCTVVGSTTDRYMYQDISVSGGTEYTLSGYVNTQGLNTTGMIGLKLFAVGDTTTELTTLYIDSSESTTNDTDGYAEGWQRLRLRFRTDSQSVIRVMVYLDNPAIGDKFWIDAIQLEESVTPSPWQPGLVGNATVIDVGGVIIDGVNGGVFRLRGSAGTINDVVELGPNGLLYSGTLGLDSARIGMSMNSNSAQTMALTTAVARRMTYNNTLWSDPSTTQNSGSFIIGVAGLYLCTVHAEFDSNTAGSWRIVGLGRAAGTHAAGWGGFGTGSGNTYAQSYGTPNTGSIRARASFLVPLAVGDWVSGWAYQNSGGNLDIHSHELTILRVSP